MLSSISQMSPSQSESSHIAAKYFQIMRRSQRHVAISIRQLGHTVPTGSKDPQSNGEEIFQSNA